MTLDATLRERLPHLAPDWVNDVILELRLRGASGAAIGAALQEADAHLAESGTDTTETFGDGRVYARALELPDTTKLSNTDIYRLAAELIATITGIAFLTAGLIGWNNIAEFRPGAPLIGAAAAVLLLLALNRWSEQIIRFFIKHIVFALVLVALYFAAVISSSVLTGGWQIAIDPVLAVGIGAVLIAAPLASELVRFLRGLSLDDPITFP